MTTFSISVKTDVPMSEQSIMEYILLKLESEDVLEVTNLVRDY